MICRECNDQLVLYVEGLLDDAQARAVEEHLAGCATCRTEEIGTRHLRARLQAAGDVPVTTGFDQRVMDRIFQEQFELTRRMTMKRRIPMFVGSAIAAALVVSLTWAALQFTPTKALATEIIARGAEAASNLKSIYLKCRMRTLPGDNFSYVALDHDLVDVQLWKQYGPPLKWRIEKPQRVAVMNGEQTVMLIGNESGVKFDRPLGAPFDTSWLHKLAALDQVLAAELAGAGAKGTVQNDKGKQKETNQITVEVGPNKHVDDYLKNKFLDTTETRRVYMFDRDTGRLENAEFYCHDEGRDVLVLEISEIKYDPEIDDSVFELQVPEDVVWYQVPERLPDNEKYAKMKPAEAARAFFTACAERDWEEAAKFYPGPLSDKAKQALGGLEVIKMGKPFQAWPYGGWFLPYEIKFNNGEVRKHNLALRNDNPAKRYVVDGGL